MKTTFTKIFVILLFVGSFGNLFGVHVTVSNINVSLDCSNYSHTGNREVYISSIPFDDMRWEFELVQDDGNLNLSNLNYSIGPEDGFYYVVPSGWYNEGGSGYVNITFSITQANRIKGAYRDVKFKCRYLNRWSGWSSWIEREFRISVNDLQISGNNLICYSPNQTYTLSGYPAYSSFNWTKSNNLTQVGGSTSTSYVVHASSTTVHGDAWVNVEVSKGVCTWEKQKDFWVGKPATPIITGNENPECYVPEWYFLDDDSKRWGNFQWSTDYSLQILGTSTGHKALIEPLMEGYGQIFCEVTNTCGSTEGRLLVYIECWDFRMSPNPADDYVEISIDQSKKVENKIDEYEVRIYNGMNIMVSQVKTSKPVIRFNTSQFINGIYTVHFIIGDKVQVKQLVIAH